jgi:hypothetical protein
LHTLLFYFTCSEEAAIRQISQLMCITKYSLGNIGSKGNVSCVFQDCKLQRILPNTPQSIINIVVTRGKKKKDLKPWKFEKKKTMRALELLVQTVPHVWKTNNEYGLPTDIVISQDHANLWPDEGNLLALPGMAVVDEVDVKGRVLDLQDSDNDLCALGKYGDDGGPALLQTVQLPDVEFEGSLYVGCRMMSGYTNASAALDQL